MSEDLEQLLRSLPRVAPGPGLDRRMAELLHTVPQSHGRFYRGLGAGLAAAAVLALCLGQAWWLVRGGFSVAPAQVWGERNAMDFHPAWRVEQVESRWVDQGEQHAFDGRPMRRYVRQEVIATTWQDVSGQQRLEIVQPVETVVYVPQAVY